MKKCLVFLEKRYEKDCLGLFGAAKELFGSDFTGTVLLSDADASAATGIADELIRLPENEAYACSAKALAEAIKELHLENAYDCILIAATHFGRILAPYLAVLLNCGLVADVTSVCRSDGRIEMIRPAFGGRMMAVVQKTGNGPVMMSVRPGVFSFSPVHEKQTVYRFCKETTTIKATPKLLEKREKPARKDIRESEVLVSGGGGAMEHFDLLSELAERLGGAVSASRMAVDSGKADRVIQVGQSGRFVHPRLYIAEGIYGALQHVAGIRQAEHIIAVNTDRYAPVCSLSDIVVEADAADFTQKLIERIDREKTDPGAR